MQTACAIFRIKWGGCAIQKNNGRRIEANCTNSPVESNFAHKINHSKCIDCDGEDVEDWWDSSLWLIQKRTTNFVFKIQRCHVPDYCCCRLHTPLPVSLRDAANCLFQQTRANVPNGTQANVPNGTRANVPNGTRATVPNGTRGKRPLPPEMNMHSVVVFLLRNMWFMITFAFWLSQKLVFMFPRYFLLTASRGGTVWPWTTHRSPKVAPLKNI